MPALDMVDEQARKELAFDLNRLVSGEMTNDEFDELYYEKWYASADSAVAEIAKFGWSLYSSDLLWPYALTGRYAVSEEIRQKTRRAVLFLGGTQEYGWPTNVECVVPFWTLWGPAFYLVVGVVMFIVAFAHGGLDGLFLGLLGVFCLSITIHWFSTRESRLAALETFHNSGDERFWPFLQQSEFDAATHSPARPESQDHIGFG